jgi:hypothetical protein
MSKALVIKGANFAQNAIEQISVIDPIPCTGITLSQSSVTLDSIGATETLTATLTPADTTETVTWVSSDEAVATVSNGVITCVSVGTATITACCGTQSATCDVTCEVIINANTTYTSLGNSLLTTSNGRNYTSVAQSTRGSKIWYDPNNILNGYKAIFASTGEYYCIPIPQGTKQIKVDYPTQFNSYVQWVLMNSQLKQTYNSTDIARRMSDIQGFIPSQIGTFTIDLTQYEDVDYDSFLFDMRAKSDFDGTAVAGNTTITFS